MNLSFFHGTLQTDSDYYTRERQKFSCGEGEIKIKWLN